MNEILSMIIALLTGIALGFLFFGGLWFTVKKAIESKIPALWFLGSFVLRMGIVLAGFYIVIQADNNWLIGLIGLSGFVVARYFVLRLTRAYELKSKSFNNDVKPSIHEA